MRVLLTGAFGNVGAQVLDHLLQMGYEVTCFDLKTKATEQKRAALAQTREFHTAWGDLRDEAAAEQVVSAVAPAAVVHVAAVVPPLAYVHPADAYEVNVNGTRRLIEAAEKLDPRPKFIYASSYSVHGPHNPHRPINPITSSTPLTPGDNYARHKVASETLLRNSRLPWTIIRLSGVFAVDAASQAHPAMLKWLFHLPYNRRQHGIDSRDAGLALANAIAVDAEGGTFVVAGDASWQQMGGKLLAGVFAARGLTPLPDLAFRTPDPEVDESWFYEEWVNTKESTAVLCYQQHTFAEYQADVEHAAGSTRNLLRALAPLLRWQMLRASPYFGRPQAPDRRTHWEVMCEAFGLAQDTR